MNLFVNSWYGCQFDSRVNITSAHFKITRPQNTKSGSWKFGGSLRLPGPFKSQTPTAIGFLPFASLFPWSSVLSRKADTKLWTKTHFTVKQQQSAWPILPVNLASPLTTAACGSAGTREGAGRATRLALRRAWWMRLAVILETCRLPSSDQENRGTRGKMSGWYM